VEPAPAARRAWLALEPIHAATYFAPEVTQRLESLGLRGFWMGYFAARAAPLGAVGPVVADALLAGFHPTMVRRALPDAWARASPEAVLAARLEAVDVALRRLLGDRLDRPDVAGAALAARRAAEGADCRGRALAAAHQALDWPADPHLVLWQAATVLREHRGDGHLAVLVADGVDARQAHVLAAASGACPAELLRASRRWSADDWAEAADGLRRRGWLDGEDGLTDAGRAARARIEAATDRLAAPPYGRLGAGELEHLLATTGALAAAIAAAGGVPFPNPMGLPRLEDDRSPVTTTTQG
jgi:hypothetical protein